MTSFSKASERPKLLLLGDSLTQTSFGGWGGGLAHRYQRRADVLNRGMSGFNTRWFASYADDVEIWKEPGNIVLTTIFFGANDASLEAENPHHFVPLSEFQENLKGLIQKTQESYPESKILLITPPPVHHKQRLAFQKQRYKERATGVLERTLQNAGKYSEACRQVANESGLPCLDLYELMRQPTNGESDVFGKYFWDGLHFSREGHDFVLKHLLEAIQEHFPSIAVKPDPITGQENNSGSKCEGIASSGPYHDQIDHKAWKDSFAGEDEPSSKRSKTYQN